MTFWVPVLAVGSPQQATASDFGKRESFEQLAEARDGAHRWDTLFGAGPWKKDRRPWKKDRRSPGPLRSCPDLVWGTVPPAKSPVFPDREALCSAIPGEALPSEFLPPLPTLTMQEQNTYAVSLLDDFLKPRLYDVELGWAGDAHWRLSGDVEGCPSKSTFATHGVHKMVRVWYSPEVVTWLCSDRPGELPVGAMIVKEEHPFQGAGVIVVDPHTHRAAPSQDLVPNLFAIMIKRPNGAWDSFYWGAGGTDDQNNPPVTDRAGLTVPAPATLPPHEAPFYPTGASLDFEADGSVVSRNFGYGMYCTNCHAVANSEQTFSSIDNIVGKETIFKWRGPGTSPICDGQPVLGVPTNPGAGFATIAKSCPPELPPNPLPAPAPDFLAVYDQVGPFTDDTAWNGVDISMGTNMPPNVMPLRYVAGQTWDRVIMPPMGEPQIFVSTDQCIGCHDGIANNSELPYMVVDDGTGRLVNLSPGSEWRNASMGLAGRDPFFMARMEAEWNHVERDFETVPGIGLTGAPTVADCVMDLCLSCHAKAGSFQHAIDTKGKGTDPLEGSVLEAQNTFICRDMLPKPLGDGLKTKEDGHTFFIRSNLQNWPGTPGLTDVQRRSPNLGREGVSCLACHLAAPDVGDPKDGFTGNIPFTTDGTLYGPDEIGDPKVVMENAIGLLPTQGEHLRDSKLCGVCHAINLPVLKSGNCSDDPGNSPFKGCVEKFSYEQTTYFEYLNSAYNKDSPSVDRHLKQECQGCHMQNKHKGSHLAFKVANIQDNSFPRYANSVPPAVLDLPLRTEYRRHAFPGLNLFLNGFVQEFPLLLGYNDFDWMNMNTEMPVLAQRDTLLEFARKETARVAIKKLKRTGDGIRAVVRVTNLAGHNLPSGVGFRRLFLEFSVLDASGEEMWVSGRTNELGQLVDSSGVVLPTETYPATSYEPHHQVITTDNEVQVYEEIALDEFGTVTTGFLHRWEVKKDNRIPPRGFRWDSKYTEPPFDVAPAGLALDDPDYKPADPEAELDGTDQIVYEVTLPSGKRAGSLRVRVRLLSQTVPPYFLSQVFEELAIAKQDPAKVANQNQLTLDGTFLHYLASRFDASGVEVKGEPYLKDWKLEVTSDERSLGREPKKRRRPRYPWR